MSTESTPIRASVPITVQIDLEELLGATIGEIPPWTGDPDDEYEPAHPVIGAIIDAAARQLVDRAGLEARQSYRSRYNVAIDERLAALVEEELQKPFLPVDTYGQVKSGAEPTSLRAEIGRMASEALAKGMNPGSTWNGNREQVGTLRKYIETEIDRVIKGELQAAVAEAKAAVVDKVKANVTQVITDAITRTAVR